MLKTLKIKKGTVIHGIGTNDTNQEDGNREYKINDSKGVSIYKYLADGSIVDQTHKKIKFDYKTDTAFTWDKYIQKDKNGKTKEILYNVSIRQPDIEKYKRGYRVLNGFEDPQSVVEACRLFAQFEEHKGDLSKVDIDWSHIFEGSEDADGHESVVSANGLHEAIIKVLLHNETSANSFKEGYTDANMGCRGEGFTFGAMQNCWTGSAKPCMKYICDENKTMAKEILGSRIFKAVYSNTNWTKSTIQAGDLGVIKKLLKTKASLNGQKKYAQHQIDEYIKEANNKGITNPQLLMYYCDLRHQGGYGALTSILPLVISKCGSIKKWNNDKNALKIFHESAMATYMGKYVTRRTYTYEQAKKLSTSIDDYSTTIGSKSGFPFSPKTQFTVSTEYGESGDGVHTTPHKGIDLAAPSGTKIYAVLGGKVVFAGEGYEGSGYNHYGWCVGIKDKNGNVEVYGHMIEGSVAVKKGQKVTAGTLIGLVGSSGWSTGPHLHFEVRNNGELNNTTNPRSMLKFPSSKTKKKK